MRVKMPTLLSDSLTDIRPVDAISLSLNVSLRDRSQASLTVSRREAAIPMRSFLRLYTHKGEHGIYRITNSAMNLERGRVYTLTHAIDTLRDDVFKFQGAFEGTKQEFLTAVFAQQENARWQIGYVHDAQSAYKAPNINYTKLSDLFSKFIQDHPDVYPSYDFSTTPWTVSILPVPTGIGARFSLTRNADTCNIVYDDKNMGNRLYLAVNTPEKVNGITKYNAELKTYEHTGSIAQYGVIAKTASVKTDEITDGDADAWALAFLEKYALPEVTITVDGYELYKQTGEIYDETSVGKRAVVSLPDFGVTTTQRIESVQYPDVLNTPTAVVVSLATKQKTFTAAISNLEKEVDKVGGVAGGAALSAADAEEVTAWSLIMQKVQEAVDGTGITTLWESGIIVDAEAGTTIYSLEQGFVSAFAALKVNSEQIDLSIKQGQENASAIKLNSESITALSQTVDENGQTLASALLRLDGVEGEVEILAEKQISLDEYENRLATAESSITTNAESITALSQTVDENGQTLASAILRLDGVEGEVEILAKKQISLDEYENRLATAESSITTNAESITALSQTVDENGQTLSSALLRLDGVEGEVEILVEKQVSLDEYENRLSTAESSIKINADNILLKADQSVVDDLTERVSSAEVDIDAANAAIALKANQSVVDDLTERVSSAEVDIDAANASITLKANQSIVDDLTERVSSAEVDIDAANAAILLKANQSVVDDLTERVSSAEIDIDAANAAITLKANQSTVNALTTRVSTAEADIDAANAAITLKANQSTVNALSTRVSSAEVDIDAANAAIALKANVSTVDELGERVSSAEIAIDGANSTIALKADKTYVDNLFAQSITTENLSASISNLSTIKNDSIQGTTGDFETLQAQGIVANVSIETAALTVGGLGYSAHSHKVSVSDDGTVTLGEVSATGGNFNLADTKFYQDGVSAAVEGVTLSASGWIDGHNIVYASNGKQKTITLPEFTTSGGTSFDSNHTTTVNFSTASVTTGPLKSVTVDASSVYNSVTATQDDWLLNGVKYVRLSNGKTYAVRLPDFTAEGGDEFDENHQTTVGFYAKDVKDSALLTATVDASSVYEDGADGVTLSASGWSEGHNIITASNGKQKTITLPEFTTSGGTSFDSNHTTTVHFSTASVTTGPLKSVTVDASDVYQDGVAYGKSIAGDVTLSSAGWINGVNTVTASNGKTLDISLPPFSTSTNGGFTSAHKMIVYFSTPSVTQPLEHYIVDASSVYTEGYNAGYNAGWAAAREEVRRVTNSAGTEVYIYGPSETVDASARFYTVGLNVSITSHLNSAPSKVTANAAANVTINSSTVITKTASNTLTINSGML